MVVSQRRGCLTQQLKGGKGCPKAVQQPIREVDLFFIPNKSDPGFRHEGCQRVDYGKIVCGIWR
ncbi:MAG: hypothetical protein JWM68_2118 [Verrucomicrobiales bacterium]|nr:hypothetical protein [Verrucomicrobiales bacterium]